MHQVTQPNYGWEEDNYIGSLVQRNTKHDRWHDFYTECRVMPLVKMLFDRLQFSTHDLAMAESFCRKLNVSFPSQSSAFLHGDLWSGNIMAGPDGHGVVVDPAVYFGHREMDIGMTKLFGGFDEHFYNSYNEVYPLEKGWLQRIPLTQLYPLLVHAVLFGGHYVASARGIIQANR